MQGAGPIRLAGLALVGVSVVALGLGIFALASNGTPNAQGRPPTTSTTTATTTTRPPTTTTTTRPPTSPTYPNGQTTTVAPPPAPTTSQTLEQSVPVRVLNNSRITGLAQNAGKMISAAGFNVVLIGSYSAGIIPATTAYYSPLPGEQQIATELGQQFGMRVEPRFPGIADASPGVIVIVTKNFSTGKG
jgi:hypothetical protein